MDGPVCRRPGRVSVCFQDECGGPDVRAGRVWGVFPCVFLLGEGADAYPLVVVESDSVQVSVLQSFESDKEPVSALPVAGCEFPAVFLGKVAFDVVGLGVGPPCLRVDSEETLLT